MAGIGEKQMRSAYRDALATAVYGRRLTELARRGLPPGARSVARTVRALLVPDVEYVSEGWMRARHDPSIVPGEVNGSSQLGGHRERWPAFVRAVEGTGPLGINHELPVPAGEAARADDLGAHNTLISFAYIVALAARRKDRLSMLDWGGAIGQYYVVSRAVLPDVEIDYSCKDAAALCAHGRTLLPEATFYHDETCFERTYDLVVASGSLALSENWSQVLGQLARATNEYLYVARLPVVFRSQSFVVLQRAYTRGLKIASLQWALNRTEFVEAAERSGMKLVREFLSDEKTKVRGAPEQIDSRHFLFRTSEENR
jgi:putative methyltransferase (TIGR04325 family)